MYRKQTSDYMNIRGIHLLSGTTCSTKLIGISKNYDNRVSTKEHFADVPVSVDRPAFLLAFAFDRILSPHLLHVLKHHITMTIKCFHSA